MGVVWENQVLASLLLGELPTKLIPPFLSLCACALEVPRLKSAGLNCREEIHWELRSLDPDRAGKARNRIDLFFPCQRGEGGQYFSIFNFNLIKYISLD